MEAYLQGFLVMLGLITTIGPQNLLVIKQAAKREHLALVVIFCLCSETILCSIAVAAGMTLSNEKINNLLVFIALVYLSFLGTSSILSGINFKKLNDINLKNVQQLSISAIFLQLVIVCLLNPHVYLDFGLIAALAQHHSDNSLYVAGGVISASTLWLVSLSLVGYFASSILLLPLVWRSLEGISGLLMLVVAWELFSAR
jgi:L-lysine exporter family protein LysE/ArgO